MYARNSTNPTSARNKIMPRGGAHDHRGFSPLAHKATRRRRRLQVANSICLVVAVVAVLLSLIGCDRQQVREAAAVAGVAGGAAGGPVGAYVMSAITLILGSLLVKEKVQHRKTKRARAKAETDLETEKHSKKTAETDLLPTQHEK